MSRPGRALALPKLADIPPPTDHEVLPKLTCTRFEVVSQVTLPGDASTAFPGDRGVMDRMRTACEPKLAPLIGSRRGSLVSLYLALLNKKSWDAGNRLGHCAISFAVPKSGRFAGAGAGATGGQG
ncbi:hypothetical protein [Streptomyces canus]|uniref:hypothetical protein n=1 Tax=Streptomyces canus TaxID=58343 RepID=UPI0037173965